MRSIITDFGLYGKTLTSSSLDIVTNYTSALLKSISEGSPLLSGDPSIVPLQPLQPLTSTTSYTRNTGKKDSAKANTILEIDGKKTFMIEGPVFNGNETTKQFTNPWTEPIPLKGYDTTYPSDLKKKANISQLIPDFGHDLPLSYAKEVDKRIRALRFNLSADTLKASKSVPSNARFNQLRYDGLLNLTSVKKAPIMISKAYLTGVDSSLTGRIQMKTSDGKDVKFD